MKRSMTPEALLAFEEAIAQEFKSGSIKAPVHLGGGNEQQLIEYFRDEVEPHDWVLCSWRSHYHCLLRGVSIEELLKSIYAGRSVSLCFPDYKILSSGIVGGTSPISVGLAWAIKRKNNDNPYGNRGAKVHVFIGDMTAETGIVHEAMKYASGHDLPIQWVIEDNGFSVKTPTQESWGLDQRIKPDMVRKYHYDLSRPHVGIGQWVRF